MIVKLITNLRTMKVALIVILIVLSISSVGASPNIPSDSSNIDHRHTLPGDSTKRVLVLCSFNFGYQWTDNMLSGINDAFTHSGTTIEQYVSFMDMKRVPYSQEYFACYKKMLETGYKGITFNAILACDNDALAFLRQYRDELFPGVPVIFSSINDYTPSMLDGRVDITGTSENTDYSGTITCASTLFPKAKCIVVVTDNTTTGVAHRSALEKIEAQFKDKILFQFLSLGDLTFDELGDTLSNLPDTCVVLLAQHFRDKNGRTYTVKQSTPIIASRCAVPCFVLTDIRMGLGTLGGDVVSGYHHGKASAEMIVSIFHGVDIRNIPVMLQSPNKYMFDFKVMRRFNIDAKQLPPGSIIINKPHYVFTKYIIQIITAAILFVVVVVFLIVMIFEVMRRKKAELLLIERNRFIESLVKMTPDILYIYDIIEKRNIYSNDGIQKVLGYSIEEIQAMGTHMITDLMHPDDFPAYLENTIPKYTIAKNDESIIHEYRMKHKTGEWRWLFSNEIIYLRQPDGTPRQVFGIIHDITERKKAEEKIREKDLQFRKLSANMPDMIFQFTRRPDGKYFVPIASEGIKNIFNCRPEDVLDDFSPIANVIYHEDAQRVIDSIEHSAKDMSLFTCEFRVQFPGKPVQWIFARSVPEKLSDGSITWFGFNADITERRRAEEALRESIEKAEQQRNQMQKLESLGVLAGGIAHDFNNLMGGIFGYIDIAIDKSKDENVTLNLSKAASTIERARALTHQLLTFSKGGAPIQKVDALFPFIQETTAFALSGSNVSCVYDIPDGIWACDYDRNQIGQVIDNIVINAQQAMPVGGTIYLAARNFNVSGNEHPTLAKGDYVRLSIKDCGVGIPKDLISKIFDPFFTTKAKGHGLGLATCYSIVKRHGGFIDVESEQGKGSTFHVFLPAIPGSVLSDCETLTSGHKGSGTFLVMDDEEVIRETLQNMLVSLGYSVVCKENGNDAVEFVIEEMVQGRNVSGAIFDLTVPGGMGGKVAVEEIRKLHSVTPVFVSSGYAEDPIMKDPAKYGFTASICKPFRKAELIEVLNKFI